MAGEGETSDRPSRGVEHPGCYPENLARARRLLDEAVELLGHMHATAKALQHDRQAWEIDRQVRAVDLEVRRAASDARALNHTLSRAQQVRDGVVDTHVVAQAVRADAMQTRNGVGLVVGAALDPEAVAQLVHRLCAGLESRVAAGEWDDGRARYLHTLTALVCARDSAQARIDDLVTQARQAGASWADLGQVLGLTRQAVHSRYRRRV